MTTDETVGGSDPAADARDLAARLATDPALRIDAAYELILARATISGLRVELDQERQRLEASVRAMAVPVPAGIRAYGGRIGAGLAFFVGGMLACVLLSWALAAVGPGIGFPVCVQLPGRG